MAFRLTAAAFRNGEFIPEEFTCDGPDISPALEWTEPPAGTESLAVIVDDPDAPAGTWVHWVLYDIPGDTRKLEDGIAKDRHLLNGARQGRNDFGKIGYNGPCPPKGGPHRYFFKLCALDKQMNLKAGASKAELERAMKGHLLAEAEVVGRFQH
jgi:Raf kinase inhibitor-like YbhB/YbcL family protein